MLAWADIRRPLIRARFAKRISSLLRAEGFSNEKTAPFFIGRKKTFKNRGLRTTGGYAMISFVGTQLCAVQKHSEEWSVKKMEQSTGYFVVKQKALPEVLLKVVEAKRLIESERAVSVQEATEQVGISRSSFYKYKDDIFPFHDTAAGRTITLTFQMDDEPGLLSDVLKIIATFGANILTIHQSIPINGVASLTISVQVLPTTADVSLMVDEMEKQKGVHYVKIIAKE